MHFYTKSNYALIQSIGFQLVKARNKVVIHMDSAMDELGLNSHLMGILILISRGEAVTPYELATQLSLDTGLMTRLLDKLEAKELIKRVRSLKDRRIVDLKVTDAGKKINARISDLAPNVLNSLLSGFTASEFKEFHRLLTKFIDQ